MNYSRVFSLAGFFGRLVLALIVVGVPAKAAIDLNGDGMGDLWALKFNATSLAAGADADNDGKTNGEESAAGTDPRSASSAIVVSPITFDEGGLHLSWPTVLGKSYKVESRANFEDATWQEELPAELIAGTGSKVTRTYGQAGANKYYRVVAQDIDTDGDGVSDYEELVAGTNPNNSFSAGLSQGNDYTRLVAALQATNVVAIQALDSAASEVGPDAGTFIITRAGNLNPITIIYTVSGTAAAGSDYVSLSGSVTLGLAQNSATVTVTPVADALLESLESVLVTLSGSAAYNIGAPSMAAVLISDSTQASGNGLAAQFRNEISSGVNAISDTNPAKFAGSPALSRIDPVIDFEWDGSNTPGLGSPGAGVNGDYFSSRWTGEVLPQYSQVYTFFFDVNRAGRIWVNGQLLVNNWPGGSAAVTSGEYSGTISLVGGVRYPIVVEQYETTGTSRAHLRWQSANQVKEVIPQTRLFANTPPQITSAKEVTLLKGSGAFTYLIQASGSPTSYGAANLPPGPPAWTVDAVTGQINGSPTQAGVWQIPITATNANGSGSALLTLTVVDTGGAITREVWTGSFTSVAQLPINTTPATSFVTALEGPQTSGGNYGSRLRGFITAPVTGAYQFWLAADDLAELWLSNDDEPINLFKRAATSGATGYRDWANAAAGKSPLLWLKAAQRYYVEVRHVDASGSGHLSVGWYKPGDTGPNTAPSGVVPGYALSPWASTAGQTLDGTLYTANLTAQEGAVTSGYGSATLRLSTDETQAVLSFSYANLSSAFTGEHVHSRVNGGAIIFDIDDAPQNADGSYTWEIVGVGAISAQQIVNLIKSGDAYLNIHTENYAPGEIKGFFRLQDGSVSFTRPPDLAEWTPDTDSNAASRFLAQATFGATLPDIALVQSVGYDGWISAQFAKGPRHHLDYVNEKRNLTDPGNATYPTDLSVNAWWKNSITADDQLRQRVALALSEIMVISTQGVLSDRANAVSSYYDTLLDGAFGNFRDLLKAVTLTPAMGIYLDFRRNEKPDKTTGRIPNENYAREILQLFSIGLNRLHPDGSLMLSSKGLPIPTYDQDAIVGFAHAFTGWTYNQPNAGGFLPTNFFPASDYVNPLKEVPGRHFTGQKRILNNVVLPGLPTLPSRGNEVLDPYAAHSAAQVQTQEYQALPAQELNATHDAIFNHPNMGPFLCRQLIQRLVTSTPSRGYIFRVVEKFSDNGAGVRGDMQAVIKAILLDYEARSSALLSQQGFGKQREPMLRVTALARGLAAAEALDGTYTQTNNLITVNTSAPHKLRGGISVALQFTSGTPAPTDRAYTVSTVLSSTSFTVPTPDIFSATYNQPGTTTITVTRNGHGRAIGNTVYLDFTSGTALDGLYAITSVTTNTFTVEAPAATTSGTAWLVFNTGGYVQSGTTITVSTRYNHCLSAGDTAVLDFSPLTGSTNVAADGAYVVTVLNAKQFTVTATDAVARSGTVVIGPGTISLNRSGTVFAAASNWGMNGTDTDLGQTPLSAPTVFNFFEPDYQFPGFLAEAGLITPEFQLTSETNVVRQSNFLFGGIFSSTSNTTSGGTTGLESFRTGGGNIALDLSPWMAVRPGSSTPWTNNENLGALVDQLATILMAGQIPSTGTNNYASNPRVIVNVRQAILDYLSNTANVAYNNSAPTDTQKRDRIRALVHLLATSADFTIQR